MNFDGRDKRIAARYTTRVFGIFGRDIDLDETEMLMMNMSLGGAFVRTDTPVPPGQPVMLRIYLDESSQPISIAGEVVWWRAPGQGKEPGMGVKFTQMSAAESARFKGFLADLIEEDLFR